MGGVGVGLWEKGTEDKDIGSAVFSQQSVSAS